jgi:hypothetical protein
MNAFNSALDARLRGTSAITSLLATMPNGTASAIYHLQAPEGATLPYVVFSLQSDVETNDTAHKVRNDLGFIRAYSGVSAVQAGSIDAAIETALDNVPLVVSGWTNLWLAREQELETVENQPSGKAIYMQGAFYRAILERTP